MELITLEHMRTSALFLSTSLLLNSCTPDDPVAEPYAMTNATDSQQDAHVSKTIEIENDTIKPIDPCDLVYHPVLQSVRDKSLLVLKEVDQILGSNKEKIKKPSFAHEEPADEIRGAKIVTEKEEVEIVKQSKPKIIYAKIVRNKPGVSESVMVRNDDNPIQETECGGGVEGEAGRMGLGASGVQYGWEICDQTCTGDDPAGSDSGYIACTGKEKSGWTDVESWGNGKKETTVNQEQVPLEETAALIACVQKAGRAVLEKYSVK